MKSALCFLVLVLSCAVSSAQCTPSTLPSNASMNYNNVPSGWAQGTSVQVYVDSTQYNPSQIAGIEQAFTNWQNSAAFTSDTYSFVVMAGQPVPTGHYVIVRNEVPTPNNIPDQLAGGNTTWNSTLSSTGSLDIVGNYAAQSV